jgi:hypothetical protein
MQDPIHLIVRDPPAAVAPATPPWLSGAVALAAGLALAAVVIAVLRWFRRDKDPYATLLTRLVDRLELPEQQRDRLLMKSGGEPRRAVGALLTGRSPRPAPPTARPRETRPTKRPEPKPPRRAA